MKSIICLYEDAGVASYDVPVDSQESYILLCPWCGNCWGRVIGRDASWWRNLFIPCINDPGAVHAYGCFIGGSLLEIHELDLLDKLPPVLIEREFSLYTRSLDECH